jgi:hypothetical protein
VNPVLVIRPSARSTEQPSSAHRTRSVYSP